MNKNLKLVVNNIDKKLENKLTKFIFKTLKKYFLAKCVLKFIYF